MTRFVAFRSRAYDTWHMRIVLALLALGAAAMAPLRADAFDLEASLKTLHVQYQGEPGLQVYVHVSGGLVFGPTRSTGAVASFLIDRQEPRSCACS